MNHQRILDFFSLDAILIYIEFSKRISVMAIRLTKNPTNIHPIYSPRTSYKRIKEQDERMIADMTLNFDKLTINLLRD